jgi:dihydropyrimidinase
MQYDLVISGGTVVFPAEGSVRCDIAIKDGIFAAFLGTTHGINATEVIDASGMHVMPGIIDGHTHVGFTGKMAEDFRTESYAAAKGGCTTILTYILQMNAYAGEHQCYVDMVRANAVVDVGFHYNIVSKEQLAEVEKYIRELGVSSFKYLMTCKGSESQRLGLREVDDGLLYEYFRKVGEFGGVPCVHCENIEVCWAMQSESERNGLAGLTAWDSSRPALAEAEAIFRSVFLAEKARCPRIYIVHLSSKEGLQMVRWLRKKGLHIEIIVETCPHYLVLDVNCDAGVLAKVNPPLRHSLDNEALWDALFANEISTVGSDHVARPKSTKEGGIWKASPGFPGTGTMLPLLLHEGFHKRGLPMHKIAELISANPAKSFGLYPQKGAMLLGSDADLTIVDLALERSISYENSGSVSDYSVYEGRRVKGWPVQTLVRGRVVMRDGEITAQLGYGNYLTRHSCTLQ